MHSLYARFVLWLIQPALERHAVTMCPTSHAASQKKFFESAIGQRGSAAWKTSSPNDRRRRK